MAAREERRDAVCARRGEAIEAVKAKFGLAIGRIHDVFIAQGRLSAVDAKYRECDVRTRYNDRFAQLRKRHLKDLRQWAQQREVMGGVEEEEGMSDEEIVRALAERYCLRNVRFRNSKRRGEMLARMRRELEACEIAFDSALRCVSEERGRRDAEGLRRRNDGFGRVWQEAVQGLSLAGAADPHALLLSVFRLVIPDAMGFEPRG